MRNIVYRTVVMFSFLSLVCIFFTSNSAMAGTCNYRLSELIGADSTTGVIGVSAAVAASDVGMKAAGLYIIVHSTSGAAMIGSTAAGASAAGTVGIIGGTAGVLGSIAAFVTTPAVIVTATVTAVAAAGTEAVCYFSDERITDYKTVYDALHTAVAANPSTMGLVQVDRASNWYWLINDLGEQKLYDVANLYIVNGELLHRDWFRNTSIGKFKMSNN